MVYAFGILTLALIALILYAFNEHNTDLSVLRSAVVKNVHVREKKNAEKNNK